MKKLPIIFLLLLSMNVYAQETDKTVTLVVSGQGKTPDVAKQNALRSAIEQAFGTFISSKTEILNDNLVKDEIVSVANGNIQKFEIISEVQIPNGDYATSLNATVSVTKLTTFVESKGIVAEFKGNILAANVKQQMLNEQNEIKSIENISNTCKEILDLSCDFTIVRGEPKQKNSDNNRWAVPITIDVNFNKNIEQFDQYFMKSIKGLCMSSDEVKQYNQLGKKTYKIALGSGAGIFGESDDIKFIETIAKSNLGLTYRFVSRGVVVEFNDIKSLQREFPNLKFNAFSGIYKILYYDKSINPIHHFRTMSTVVKIIDLIYYTKHSVLNFQITNGLDTIKPEKLITDLKSNSKDYGFKIIKDNLTPIFNQGIETSVNGQFSYANGADGILKSSITSGYQSNLMSMYSPVVEYNRKFYFNGGQYHYKGKQYYNGKVINDDNAEIRDQIYKTKYGFLVNVNKEFSDPFNSYQTVISLFDFKPNGDKIITLNYDDILALTDIEKVQEYKINPISKN